MYRSLKRVAAIIAATALVLSGCSGGDGADSASAPEDSERAAEGRTPEIVIGICCDPAPLDPVLLRTPIDRMVASAVFEPLVEVSENGDLVPGLAVSWESEDAQTWTVGLRENVRFSDGEPFNADAVVANFERSADPASGSRPEDLEQLETITALDELTVEFVMTEPVAAFPAFLNEVVSNMVSPAVLDGDVADNPIATGPFLFESRTADEVRYVRNPDYWDPELPKAERIVFKIIPDSQSQLAALQAGDTDVVPNTTSTTNAQVEGITDLKVLETVGLGTMHVFLNAKHAPFDDVNARVALAHATDRASYIKFMNADGEGEMVDGPWPSGMPVTGSLRSDSWPAYDPERAREMVDDLGGLSFTLLTYNAGDYPQQAQVLQDMWSEAGIEVSIDLQESAAAIEAATVHRNHQAFMAAWSGRPDPDLNVRRYLHSSSSTSPSGIQDEIFDDLIERAGATPDSDERVALYQEVVNRIGEIVPVLYLESLPKTVVARDNIAGIVMPPDGNIRPQYLYIEG